MTVTITPLGGVGEVGRNCIAVDIDGKIIICDMGFHLERYIEVTEDKAQQKHLSRRLQTAKAIPDKRWLVRRKKDIVGICISHAHLDHVGGIQFLAKQLNCPVYATKFAANIIRSLCERTHSLPQIKLVKVGETVIVGKFPVEFIRLSHSTPESCALAITSPNDGVIVYANDYKNDTTPPFELPTDVARLQELQGKVSFLILDSLYAHTEGSCLSESYAREKLLGLENQLKDKRAIIMSTFSSHIYRLKTLLDVTKNLGRTPVFLGRSLAKYLEAGDYLLPESKHYTQLKFRSQIDEFLRTVSEPEKYVFITTGHQGEPNAVLSRMADGLFEFTKRDAVVFSCKTIPTPITLENRKQLEEKLRQKGVSCLLDYHVSGHAHGGDHREIISWLTPKYVLPAHAEKTGVDALLSILKEFPSTKPVKTRLNESFSFYL